MANVLTFPEQGWSAMKQGTYVKEYSDSIISKDTRTALQKAIDKHSPYVNIERKKIVEEGDLQMNDGSGWEQFCIHKAQKLIRVDGKYIALRAFKDGQWINYKKERNDIFCNLMIGKTPYVSNGPSASKHTREWYEVVKQDRDEAHGEGNYDDMYGRRYI